MNSDKLIERLREEAAEFNRSDKSARLGVYGTLLTEAAHQLELQARENDQQHDTISVLTSAWAGSKARVERLRTENDQLRAALRKFALQEIRIGLNAAWVGNRCGVCGTRSETWDTESHAEGCLASPPALRDDHD